MINIILPIEQIIIILIVTIIIIMDYIFIGRFQKISTPYHGRLLGFPKGRGGSRLWNSEGMGGIYDWKSEGMARIPQVGFLE